MESVNLAALSRAIEARDGGALKTFYAKDAVLLIIDQVNQPNRPKEIKGDAAIASYFDDVCSRPMTHSVENGVEQGDRIAFTQACRYPDGKGVFCSATVKLAEGKIANQVMVQAWDE
jgi:ketosteroid isomerase-like protein